MSVRDIVDQFTDTNFTLIVHDCGYYGDNIFNGPADDIYDDPAGGYPVVGMEPPKHAYEVILYVDIDKHLDIDSYELFAED